MYQGNPRRVFASVATYTPLDLQTTIQTLTDAYQTLIQPYTDDPDIESRVAWCRAGTSRQQITTVSNVNWANVNDSVPLAWLMIKAWKERNLQTPQSPEIAAVCAHFASKPERASVIEFSIMQPQLGATIPRTTQVRLVEWATATFVAIRGIVGYITVDYVSADMYGSMSPYETTVGLSYPWASRTFRDYARGYYWGNLLNQSHIERIGGATRLAELPLAAVRQLDDERFFVQLTDDINNIDRAKLAELKQIVQPLLPEGYPQTPQYYQNLPDFVL